MGLGSILLTESLQRVVQASQVMAVYTLVVDALTTGPPSFINNSDSSLCRANRSSFSCLWSPLTHSSMN